MMMVATTGATSEDYIYVSIDNGASWTKRGPKAGWTGIAIANYGGEFTAVAHGRGIYVSQGPVP